MKSVDIKSVEKEDTMTFKLLRQMSGMNMTQFAEYFGIPYRTIQNWEGGVRQCPEYLMELMRYKLEHEGLIPMRPKPIVRKSGYFNLDGPET